MDIISPTYRVVKVSLQFWEIVRIVGIACFHWHIRQLRIVSDTGAIVFVRLILRRVQAVFPGCRLPLLVRFRKFARFEVFVPAVWKGKKYSQLEIINKIPSRDLRVLIRFRQYGATEGELAAMLRKNESQAKGTFLARFTRQRWPFFTSRCCSSILTGISRGQREQGWISRGNLAR